MSWQLSMALFFMLSTAAALWRRVYSQKSALQGKAAPALGYVIATAPIGAVIGLAMNDWYVEWNFTLFALLALMAAGIALFNWLVFEASKKLPVAILFQILFPVQTITTIVIGALFLGETLTLKQLAGGVLLIAGAMIAARAHIQKRSPHVTRAAVITAVLAAVSLATGVSAEKAALEYISFASYLVIGFAFQAIALLIIAQKDIRSINWRRVHRYEWLGAFLMGAIGAVGGLFFINAMRTADNVALVTVVSTFQMPLIAIAGYFILKEKEIGWKLALALVVAFAGLLITAL